MVIRSLQPTELLSGTCNSGQIAAIEAALATPDLLLIQGPPGTGKTTVIAEICYQVALSGGRTLIASQSNLAVDNALGRIIHSPRIRALRKGNPDSVEDEGRDFTEERVVQKWLNDTAHDCQTKLEKRKKDIALLTMLLRSIARFSRYCVRESQWEKDQISLQRKLKQTTQEVSKIEASITQTSGEEKNYLPIQNAFSAVLAGSVDWHQPGFDEVLQDSFQYLTETGNKQQFSRNFNECLRIIEQIGLTLPAKKRVLGGVVWLQGTVHTYSGVWAESRQLISQIEGAIAELSKVSQQHKTLADSLLGKKDQLQRLTMQIDSLQNTIQSQITEINALQRATAALNAIPRNGAGSIPFILQEFHRRRTS